MLLLKITTGQRASRLLAHEGFSHSEEREEVWQVAASQVAERQNQRPETRDQRRQQDLDLLQSELLLEQILAHLYVYR